MALFEGATDAVGRLVWVGSFGATTEENMPAATSTDMAGAQTDTSRRPGEKSEFLLMKSGAEAGTET